MEIRLWLLKIVLIICTGLFYSSSGLAEQSSRTVLLIHSYHKGLYWTDTLDTSIRSVLARHPRLEVVSEYLDTKRWPMAGVAGTFKEHVEKKFSGHPPLAVIVSDNNALTFMQATGVLPGVPLIFCGINNFVPQQIRGLNRPVTGVVEKTDPGGTLDLIHAVQPDLQRLAIITDTTPTGLRIAEETRRAMAERDLNVPVIWQKNLNQELLVTFLESLTKRDAVLLLTSSHRDAKGHFYDTEESARTIALHTAAPVYGLWDFILDAGVVGGNMVYSREQGMAAARLCLALLTQGLPLPPVETASPNAVLINYKAFTAHHLHVKKLPPEAVVVNRPVSFYQAHKGRIIFILGVIGVLTILVFILSANIIRRKESEDKYRNLFDFSKDAIFVVDKNLRVLDCNQAACTLFGTSSRESFLNLVPPVDLAPEFQPDGQPSREKACHVLNAALVQKTNTTEWRHQTLDGRIFDAQATLSPVTISGRTAVLVTIRDISEQKKTQEMMIQSEKMMSVGGLAAGMAHEINNPLAAIIQNTSVLSNRLGNPDLPANLKAAREAGVTMEALSTFMQMRGIFKMIRAIADSGTRMATIVNNMLNFARKGDHSLSSHNIAELLDDVLTLAATGFNLKKQYDFKKITIKKQYAPSLPGVICEGSTIQQVLFNILQNGAQAMLQCSNCPDPTFVLRLIHEEDQGMLRVEIQDNGPGMDDETAKRIFEPFFTTKPVGVGTGLGLSVSYFIITTNHKGTLTVETQKGQGANFIIRLPVQAPQDQSGRRS